MAKRGVKWGPLRLGRRVLFGSFFVVFATKALIPIGYMPSAISDGSPVKLCDGGLHGGRHAGHNSDDEHGSSHQELQWKYCALGALAAAGAIPVEFDLNLGDPGSDYILFRYIPQSAAAPIFGFRSRAPPLRIPLN